MLTLLALAVSLHTAAPSELVQDPAQAAPPLQAVFAELTQREPLIVTGIVKKHSSDAGRGVMMIGGMGGGGERYTGGFEASVDPSGRRLIVGDGFPGFGIYSGDRGKLTQVYFEDAPLDVSGLDAELASLFDFKRLARFSGDVKWEAKADGDAGRMVLKAELPGKLIAPASGGSERDAMMRRFQAQVMRVDAEVELEGGMLRTARFSLVYSDPMAKMRRGAAGGSGGAISFSSDDEEAGDEELEEGDVIEYRMRFSRGKPTKGLRTWEQVSAILLAAKDNG